MRLVPLVALLATLAAAGRRRHAIVEEGVLSPRSSGSVDGDALRLQRGGGDSEEDRLEASEMNDPHWFQDMQKGVQQQADKLHLRLSPQDAAALAEADQQSLGESFRHKELASAATDTPALDSSVEQERQARVEDEARELAEQALMVQQGEEARMAQTGSNGTLNATVASEPAEVVEVMPKGETRHAKVGYSGTWIGVLGSPTTTQCVDAVDTLKQTQGGAFSGPAIPSSCFNSYYAEWLSAAGARVIGIPFDASDALLDEILSGVSAVVWPGGDVYLESNTTLYQTARKIMDRVLTENQKGRLFPLLGICQGYELMAALVAGTTHVLSRDSYHADGVALPIRFTRHVQQSPFFATVGADVVKILASNKVATHIHADGVTPDAFMSNRNLAALFNIVATTEDLDGKPMVSIMEGKKWPLIGFQWHPERPQFDWRPEMGTPHTPEAVASMAAIADAFVNIARLAPRSMSTESHVHIVRQCTTFAMQRIVLHPQEAGIASLLFDPPVPLGMDPESSKTSDHAWRIPSDKTSEHRVDVKLSMEDASPAGEGVNATTGEPFQGNATQASPLPEESGVTDLEAQQQAADAALDASGQVEATDTQEAPPSPQEDEEVPVELLQVSSRKLLRSPQ
jgi:gamma-glutamyl hydrolase